MANTLIKKIESHIRSHNTVLVLEKPSTTNEVRYAIRWIMRDNPDIFWFAHQYHYDEGSSTIHFQYTFSSERVKTIQQSIKDVIDNDFCLEYVKKLPRQEQVAYVYKWLVTYCTYNTNSAYNQSIYSVFVRRNSVCTGYAKAAQYLFNLLGIESRLVFGRLHNDKEDGRHCWNLVNVDNEYYHFDACFGDSVLDEVAKRSGVQKIFKIDGINYNFLCVSTDEILKTRSIEDVTTLPICPFSWSKTLIKSLAKTRLKQREGIKGCLLSHIGSSADIHLCSKDKNTVLKIFRTDSKTTSQKEYHYMQQTKGCRHLLQCNEQYTDIIQNTIAIEQATPIVDLLCSHYYELSLKGLIKMAADIAKAWKECQRRGVLYRDIHICNIYRSNDGTFKLGDFGSCTNDFYITETVGNQWFMAPETFVAGVFTESSAIYSISMVMYFILNNLRPAFWAQGCEDKALLRRMNGENLPIPAGCVNFPPHIKPEIDRFFRKVSAPMQKERISSIAEYIYELERLTFYCEDSDYIIHRKGTSLNFDLDAGNQNRLDNRWYYISRVAYHRYAMGEDVENCSAALTDTKCGASFSTSEKCSKRKAINKTTETTDEVESFARTMACHPCPSVEATSKGCYKTAKRTNIVIKSIAQIISPLVGIISGAAIDAHPSPNDRKKVSEPQHVTFASKVTKTSKIKDFFYAKIFGKKYNNVFSSIFAPAEVKRKSHLQVQVYFHLYEETKKVKSLAKESDKNAERRDYIPLSLKLKKGDKVDVECNVYGETRLASERKSIIWQGSFTKCSFDYFVPKDLDVDELSCEANFFVNGAMIGEMRFITQIVDAPRNLNPEILSKSFKKIFISYAHKDFDKVKFMAKAYNAQGVDYFFDRDYLKAGDIYPKKIKDYINTSDLFILCWSENAAKSEYVEKERTQALSLSKNIDEKKGTLTIHPLSIEPRAELPSDMKDDYNFEVI